MKEYTHQELRELVKNTLNSSMTCDNVGVNMIDKSDAVQIFEDRCEAAEKGSPYMFARPTIYHKGNNPKTYSFGEVGIEIYKIDSNKFKNFKNSRSIHNVGNHKAYAFSINDAELVYSEKKPVIGQAALPGITRNFNMISERDWICVQLRIPKASKPWINDLIKEKLNN